MEHCIQCGKQMPKSQYQKANGIYTRANSIAFMDPQLLFCTLRCAARYGVNFAYARQVKNMPFRDR